MSPKDKVYTVKMVLFTCAMCIAAATARSPHDQPSGNKPMAKYMSVPGPTGVVRVAVPKKPKPTNFTCLTFSWTLDPPGLSNFITSYQLVGGNSDDTMRWFWSFPASNNSLTIGPPNKEPCWFQVQLIDEFGRTNLSPLRLYTNVPAWPLICCYNVHGTNYVGWWASTNHIWQVLAVGSTNPIFTINPSSNMLVQAPIPPGKSGVWYQVLEQ